MPIERYLYNVGTFLHSHGNLSASRGYASLSRGITSVARGYTSEPRGSTSATGDCISDVRGDATVLHENAVAICGIDRW